MLVADVVLVDRNALHHDPHGVDHAPVLTKAVEVSPGIELGCIEAHVAENVMPLTRLRGPRDDVSVLYGLVRSNPPGSSWDEDNELSKVVFLSHLVRPQEMGVEYAARVTLDDKNQVVDVIPADVSPAFARAYCFAATRRRWFTQEDAGSLRGLVSAYTEVRPSLTGTRLGQALSTYVQTPFIYGSRPRAQLLTAILEGLVSTNTERAAKQFQRRIPALATRVGMPECDREWADITYKLRSKLAHGAPMLDAKSEDKAKLEAVDQRLLTVDELLRRILRTALEDAALRNWLVDIDVELPVPGYGCPRCRATHAELLEMSCPACKGVWRDGKSSSDAAPGGYM